MGDPPVKTIPKLGQFCSVWGRGRAGGRAMGIQFLQYMNASKIDTIRGRTTPRLLRNFKAGEFNQQLLPEGERERTVLD